MQSRMHGHYESVVAAPGDVLRHEGCVRMSLQEDFDQRCAAVCSGLSFYQDAAVRQSGQFP